MKTKLFIILPLLALISCNNSEPTNTASTDNTSRRKVLFEGSSPYLDWYYGQTEAFVSYSFRDITNNTKDKQSENVRVLEDNTITLKNGVKVRVHDEYKLTNLGEQTKLQLTRSAVVVPDENQQAPRRLPAEMNTPDPQVFEYIIQTATPVEITSPAIDPCDPMPYCYYDDFVVEWNADPNNTNGVVVIAEWNGGILHSPSENISLVSADLFDDTGTATLNSRMFEGMPDNALVHLWFIRGNLLTINENDAEVSLQDLMDSSPEDVAALLEANPELYIQLQPFMFGSGAVSVFSFFLVRDL